MKFCPRHRGIMARAGLGMALGAVLAWLGLTLIGLLAVHMFEHRYFGWGVVRARLVEDLLAWVLPSLALGLALGRWLVRGTTVVALVAATTLLALLNPLPWQDGPLDWSEFGAVFFMLALNPGGLVLVALLAGARLDLELTTGSVGGGLAGMALGIVIGRRIAGPTLQKLFAGMIVAVAAFMLIKLAIR